MDLFASAVTSSSPIPGWQPLVICGTSATHMCTFSDMVGVVQNLITDMVILGLMATTLVLMYAGYLFITAGMRGDSGAMGQAKKMLWNVVIGFAVMIAAWLVVYTITEALLKSGYSLLK